MDDDSTARSSEKVQHCCQVDSLVCCFCNIIFYIALDLVTESTECGSDRLTWTKAFLCPTDKTAIFKRQGKQVQQDTSTT